MGQLKDQLLFRICLASAALSIAFIPLPAFAQSDSEQEQVQTETQPEKPEKKSDELAQAPDPLGEQLSESEGVIRPPKGVDPEIQKPTPDTGTTPVIPPPGTPGGDPSVRPK